MSKTVLLGRMADSVTGQMVVELKKYLTDRMAAARTIILRGTSQDM